MIQRLTRSIRWRLHVTKARATDPTWHWGHPDDWTDEEWWDYCRGLSQTTPRIPAWFA